MAALRMTLHQNIIDLFLHSYRTVLMRNDVCLSSGDETKHLLSPEAKLCSRVASTVIRVGEDGEDVVVHGLSHEGLLTLAWVESREILLHDSLEFGLRGKPIFTVPRVNGMSGCWVGGSHWDTGMQVVDAGQQMQFILKSGARLTQNRHCITYADEQLA